MIDKATRSFFDLLEGWNQETSSVGNEDILAAVLPLMRQVAENHAAGKVAPLFPPERLLEDHGHLFYPETEARAPIQRRDVLNRRGNQAGDAVEVVEELIVVSDDVTGVDVSDARVADDSKKQPTDLTPRYLTGYRSWEVEAGHHDPLTDIFGLGMLIASLATGLDFRAREALELFTQHRKDLARLNNRLSPVICRAIERMTELERFDRAQDVAALVAALENHRVIGSDFEADLSTSAAFGTGKANPQGELLKRLRARLYDMTKRNRLIYHRPVSSELNLTETSVPLVMNFAAIRPDDLFTANAAAMRKLLAGKEVPLRDYIRFEEMLFAPSVLAKLRAESRRVSREFGAAPLRLVPVFLRWYDLKNAPDVPISSPLLLLRTELKKRKGVKDVYTLKLLDTEAEVNPALAFVLEKLYGMRLPTTVDLSTKGALADLHALIEKQIMVSEPGVKLTFSDRPRLRVLHQKVRRRLNQFTKRRMAVTRGLKQRSGLSYSYDHPGYNPLGLQLFREYVTPAEAPNQALFGRVLPRQFNVRHMSDTAYGDVGVTEKEATTFEQVSDIGSRFDWSFDLCAVTLANFNYRKMSLVRDYDAMLTGEMEMRDSFDKLFGARDFTGEPVPSLPRPEHQYPVIAMDPSQERAVMRSRSGGSYVIQGPPGTGKSQTISNLIADFIGQGKRVLFVCEKRAALDVVYNRLCGIGLGSMCALVHDSQQNKHDFIQELEAIYTTWTGEGEVRDMRQIELDRRAELDRLQAVTEDLRVLLRTMTAPAAGSDRALTDVLEQALSHTAPPLAPTQTVHLCDLATWTRHHDAVARAQAGLARLTGGAVLAERPERLIAAPLWAAPDSLEEIPALAEKIRNRASQLVEAGDLAFGDGPFSLGTVLAQIHACARLAPLVEVGMLAVLDSSSSTARALKGEQRLLDEKAMQIEKAREKTPIWHDKLTPSETDTALALARQKEGKLFSFLSGDWRRLKALVENRTNTSGLAVKPRVTERLTLLQTEHKAVAAHADAARQLALRHGLETYSSLTDLLAERDSGQLNEGPATDAILAAIQTDPASADAQVVSLARLATVAQGLLDDVDGLLVGLEDLELTSLTHAIDTLADSGPRLIDLQFLLAPLAEAPTGLWTMLRLLPLPPDQMAAAILDETVRRSVLQAPGLATINMDMLAEARVKIGKARAALQGLNARLLEGRAIENFDQKIALTAIPDRDLPHPDRAQKSAYAKARKALEHEFKKTRAYRSPREMLGGPAGALLPTLKPIWLMSPLSVADVLPLDSEMFDVVIFDEASQIPVEDAIPTLIRAPQFIVVGDEKQLPPTNFFGASVEEDEFDDADTDHDFELNQESFLTLASERLEATMLSWHYRSRAEELIGFSNQSFYQGRLLTIPSPLRLRDRDEIRVTEPAELPMDAEEVLARPISFHLLEDGEYVLRRNPAEARYIAHLLRDILAKNTGQTIGIVAFSEAQQSEIELALNQLSSEDKAFSRALEAEYEREEDGEFIGLFVKNLENVQGDERDIIILSICYGPNASGKMLMNFGPINKMGGEKRLNVIFSRAKRNMVVVSSVRSDRITNDYNQGAHALKTFLRYAEMMSIGNEIGARAALKEFSGRVAMDDAGDSVLVAQMAEALRGRGFLVREGLGLSEFTVDLALRRDEGGDFALGILVDTPERHHRGSLMETLTDRAALLEGFGWNVLVLTAREWWEDPDRVLERVEQTLGDTPEGI